MAIANRITRLFRADVHAVLDIIEEPEAILKQAIREMQEALDLKRARLARDQKTSSALAGTRSYLKEQLSRVQKNLELCLKEGSEELARKIVGRKLAYEKHVSAVEQRISSLEKALEQQTRENELQQGQLESIVEKAKIFVSTAEEDSPFSVAESILFTAGAGPGTTGFGGMQVSEEEVELEWLRLRDGFAEGGAS